jgi:hypothetical protein
MLQLLQRALSAPIEITAEDAGVPGRGQWAERVNLTEGGTAATIKEHRR